MLKEEQHIWYPEVTYQLIGLAYNVFNTLGYGYHEKYYQRGYAVELARAGFSYQREQSARIQYEDKIIGRYIMDFVVSDTIVIEWKVGRDFYDKHVIQVLAYLKTTGIHLGLIILCTPEGIRIKRIVN